MSVGYAACHWCHVMAHESFENPDIARLMNQHFINIKVDRQERPDLDDIYQKVVQMLGQGGGWPLTVFVTPQGEPFFGGTYFPPEASYGRPGFAQVLLGLSHTWQQRRAEVRAQVEQFLKGYRVLDERLAGGAAPTRWVGESPEISSGNAVSILVNSRIRASYSASLTAGASWT